MLYLFRVESINKLKVTLGDVYWTFVSCNRFCTLLVLVIPGGFCGKKRVIHKLKWTTQRKDNGFCENIFKDSDKRAPLLPKGRTPMSLWTCMCGRRSNHLGIPTIPSLHHHIIIHIFERSGIFYALPDRFLRIILKLHLLQFGVVIFVFLTVNFFSKTWNSDNFDSNKFRIIILRSKDVTGTDMRQCIDTNCLKFSPMPKVLYS